VAEAPLPGELKKALANRPAAAAAFDKLTPVQKAEIVRWIAEAKGPELKARRAGLAAARLTGG
jgi:uncharacterized protein YdeI (YjbR/CyaY-like superfamily)